MAQVTVEKLAETVGASVDRLLAQMKDAGLPHREAAEEVSDEERERLLGEVQRRYQEAMDPRYAAARLWVDGNLVATSAGTASIGVNTIYNLHIFFQEELNPVHPTHIWSKFFHTVELGCGF